MGWKDAELQYCVTIFYFDCHYSPRQKDPLFINMSNAILTSKIGLAQEKHPNQPRTPLQEFDAIFNRKKDTLKILMLPLNGSKPNQTSTTIALFMQTTILVCMHPFRIDV